MILSKLKNYINNNKYWFTVGLILLLSLCCCAYFIHSEYIIYTLWAILIIPVIYLLIFYTEKMFYLTCFLIPFSRELREFIPTTTVSFSIPSEPMLAGIMLLFLLIVIMQDWYPKILAQHKISLVFYLYIFWLLITSITSTMPLVSFKFLIAKLCFIVPAYFFFSALLHKDLHKASTFFLCYATSLAVVVCITTYKHIMLADVRKVAYWVMSPYYNDHTAYGAVLAFFVPVLALLPFVKSLPIWKKKLSVILLVPIILGLYLSFSRAAWLSVACSLGLYIFIRLRIKFKYLLLALIVFGGVFFAFQDMLIHQLHKNSTDAEAGDLTAQIQSITNISTDASNVERLNRWSSAIDMFKEKPFLGFGPGTFQFQYAPYQNANLKTVITTNAGDGGNAHSEYLGALSESGLFGMLIIIVLVFGVIIIGIKTIWVTDVNAIKYYATMAVLALTSYFIHGILNNFLDTDKLAIPVFGAMAIIVACNVRQKIHMNRNREEVE